MTNFQNKIAVITGAAKGIGRGLAEKCAALGCRLVLADIDKIALESLAYELKNKKVSLCTARADVSKEADIKKLAQITLDTFGAPHLLFNNAGVSGYVAPVWKLTAEKIRHIMDINFMSVVYAIQQFVPHMLQHGQPAHIINTASMAGFYAFPYFSSYIISKHSVIALSECLYHDLKRQTDQLHVSVLCPGGVNTEILEASSKFSDAQDEEIFNTYDATDVRFITNFMRMVRKGITPVEIAEHVFTAIQENKFYILTHPELKQVVNARNEAIMQESSPTLLDLYEK